MRALLIPSLLMVAAAPALALNPKKPLSDLMHQSWSVDEGLPHSTVRAIVQSPDGYLWFATHEGAARFDGSSFTVFDQTNAPALLGNGVASMLNMRDGSLVLGLRIAGLARYVRGKFEPLNAKGTIPPGTVYHLAEDNSGALWAAVATSGLVRIANGEATLFTTDDGLPGNSITALRVLANGELWVGTANGLAVLRDGKFVRNPTGTWLDGASIAGLVEDRNSNLWFAINGQGVVVRENNASNTLRRFGKREGLSTEALTRILTDRDGGVWVGSLEGIYRLVGNNFERFGTPDGFTNNYVRDIFEDGEGSVWIGTDSGINRFRDATITTWGVRKGLTEEFSRAVLEDRKGRIWVATADGLFAMSGGQVRRYGREHGLLNGAILSLAEDASGNLWVGSNAGGLHRLSGDRFQQLSAKFGVPAAPVRAILPARDGTLWIGTGGGLLKASWKQDATAKVLRLKDGLPSEQVSTLHEDAAGRIWIGTRGGLGMIAPGADVATTKGFDIDASVLSINDDAEGRLWISTGAGLWVGSPAASPKLRLIKPEEGVPMQAYFHSLDDMAGHVWSCGNRGIVKIRKVQLDELISGKRSKLEPAFYGRSEGMTTAQCNGASQPAGWRTRDGRLMFPTARGVAVAEPGREATRDLRAPPVHVKEVLIDTERVEYGADRFIAVPPGKHRVEISYVGLSMADPEKVRYRYQLKGFDAAWVEAGREAKAVYTNVAPGKYEFRVITAREGGAWSEDGSALTIEQRPHFYETVWFRVIGALAIMLAGLAVYRARIAQLNAQGVRLQQMVDERTQALELEKQKLEAANNDKAHLLIQVADAAKAYEKLSKEDSLTGISNRRELDRFLALEFERAVRNQRPLSVALGDIDFFKKINDLHSHAVGDEVLKQVALILKDGCRNIDMVGRYGGEEFVLVLPDKDIEQARHVCERLRASIEQFDWAGKGAGPRVTMSFGLATLTNETSYERLVAIADERLYEAKEAGRNRVSG